MIATFGIGRTALSQTEPPSVVAWLPFRGLSLP